MAGAQHIHVAGGICNLSSPLQITRSVNVHGDGRTAFSGGHQITGWGPSPRHPGSGILVADVSHFPIPEIKSLRLGGTALLRGRWPKRVGDGLTSPNFMFAMPWSQSVAAPADARTWHGLGIDPTKLPLSAQNFSDRGVWHSTYAHILGCVEKDVNSQLTRVMNVSGTPEPLCGVLFRNAFTVAQRFYFENVDWGALDPSEFYHDMLNHKLYIYPCLLYTSPRPRDS
eukprot:TRINITY_DN27770_c0_g1_i1.p1 TRINITY_DN27770_c0_g1~~TRINITY_DN27770_c0_g1_i1.p1  ORF type:complete len:227 (-),score=40.66 TRINITY_DN27770_c0_g1_i1:95-775(-)